MANDLRGQADITIGGEALTIRFDFNALREAQLALSLSGGADLFNAIQRMDFNAIQTLLWIGLKAKKPELKFSDVGKMDFEVGDAINAITLAVTSALGKPKEGERGKA